jgi:hypothetical protein
MSGAEFAFYKLGKSYYPDNRLRGGETLVRVSHIVNIFSEILNKRRMASVCVAAIGIRMPLVPLAVAMLFS